jgi:hypothetical protein
MVDSMEEERGKRKEEREKRKEKTTSMMLCGSHLSSFLWFTR